MGLVGLIGCVEVPDGIRAQFADTSSQERSNFRKGTHGLALPTEEPVAKLASADAGAADAATSPLSDASTASAPSTPVSEDAAAANTTDGGAP